jgi:hypothetical protein
MPTIPAVTFPTPGADTINIQFPFGALASYSIWNGRPELLIETECVLRKLLGSESFREVTHCRACRAIVHSLADSVARTPLLVQWSGLHLFGKRPVFDVWTRCE